MFFVIHRRLLNKHMENSVFRILGASNHTGDERQEHDYYATDPKAIELLLEAAEEASNIAITPYCLFDAAAMYEAKDNTAEANKLYERITKEYPQSPVARQAKILLEAAK